MNSESIFTVEPDEGTVPPLGQMQLSIIACPDDVILFKDRLELTIADTACPRQIELSATGQGGTVVTDPPMPSVLRIGPVFSATPMRKTFTVTNKGRRQQQLIWSIEGQVSRRVTQVADLKLPPFDSTWSITPHRFDINPDQSVQIVLEVNCPNPQTVKRRIFCNTIVGRRGAKTLIKTVDLSVNFVEPSISFSMDELIYRVEKGPLDVLEPLTQQVTLKNCSGLALNCNLELVYPFQLMVEDIRCNSQSLKLEPEEGAEVLIAFDPAYKPDLYCRRANELLFVRYAEHPRTDSIGLIGEVYFPNVKLDSEQIEFGHILNNTEVTRYLTMTNISPLPVRFRWSFLVGEHANVVFRRQVNLSPRLEEEVTFLPNDSGKKDVIEEHIKEEEEEEKEANENKITSETLPVDRIEGMLDTERCEVNEENTKEQSVHEAEDGDQQGGIVAAENSPMEDQPAMIQQSKETTEENAANNQILACLLESENDVIPLGIEEVFDITPLYGELASGEERVISFVFFGHSDIEAAVTAVCEVDGGPTYRLQLSGGASCIDYLLDRTLIQFDPVRFDKPAVGELQLTNTGQVGFEFSIYSDSLLVEPADEQIMDTLETSVITGQLLAEPAIGYLDANESCTIRISYLARKPEVYERSIHLQIAHFAPKLITVRGVADFIRLSLDLPRRKMSPGVFEDNVKGDDEKGDVENDHCLELDDQKSGYLSQTFESTVYDLFMKELLAEVRSQVARSLTEAGGQSSEAICSCHNPLTRGTTSGKPTGRIPSNTDLDPLFLHASNCPVAKALQYTMTSSWNRAHCLPEWVVSSIPDIGLQMEAERWYVCALIDQRLQADEMMNTKTASTIQQALSVLSTTRTCRSLPKPSSSKFRLPSYLLDFGAVVAGTTVSRVIRSVNTAYEPVSFRFDQTTLQAAAHLGFRPSVSRIRQLPGAPDYRFIDWEMTFDPKEGHITPGVVGTELLINLVNGPIIPIWLQAEVTVPKLTSHLELVEFGDVQHGEARLIAVQLENPTPVPVHWYQKMPIQKNSPGVKNRRIRSKMHPAQLIVKSPSTFEVIPHEGVLKPGEKSNVQIRFAPVEGRLYEEQITFCIKNSKECLHLRCRGFGLEPQLEFDQSLLQFLPCLPYSYGDEKIVTVSNPCDFPIEFYSTELDWLSYEQDRILRSLDGYDEYGTLLLPPRKPGEGLPQEIVDFYQRIVKMEQDKSAADSAERVNESPESTGRGKTPRSNGYGPKLNELSTHPSPERITNGGRCTSTDFLATATKLTGSGAARVKSDTVNLNAVALCIARHLGIDLTADIKCSPRREGIAVIVHGPLETMRKVVVSCLESTYSAATITVDQVILEALAASSTEAANHARRLCLEAGRKVAEAACQENAVEEDEEPIASDQEVLPPTKRLSTQISAMKEQRSAEVLSPRGSVLLTADIKNQPSVAKSVQPKPVPNHGEGGPDVRLNTPPVSGPPIPRRISVTGFLPTGAPMISFLDECREESENPEANTSRRPTGTTEVIALYSTVLPEDLVVTLLQEHIRSPDYHKGVIINGLESQFTESRIATAQIVLKALQDRHFIYAVTVKSEYAQLKALEEELESQQLAASMAAKAFKQQRAEEIDELEYCRLSEDERHEIDEIRVCARRAKRRVELEKKRIREEQQREEQEAEARRLEMERLAKKKGKKLDHKTLQPTAPAADARGNSSRASARPVSDRRRSVLSASPGVAADAEKPGATVDKRRTSKINTGERPRKSVASLKDEAIVEEDEIPVVNEEDRLLSQKFKNFEVEFSGVCELFSRWDKISLTQRLNTGPEEEALGSTSTQGNKRTRGAPQTKGAKHSHPKLETSFVADSTQHSEAYSTHLSPMPPIYCERVYPSDALSTPHVSEPYTSSSGRTGQASVVLGVPHLIFEPPLNLIPRLVQDAKHEVLPPDSGAAVLRLQQAVTLNLFGDSTVTEPPRETNIPFEHLLVHLPTPDEVLDYLGLGSKGPPIPPPVDLSVVHYPPKRSEPFSLENSTGRRTCSTVCQLTTRRIVDKLTSSSVKNLTFEQHGETADGITGNLNYFQFLPSGLGDPIVLQTKQTDSVSSLAEEAIQSAETHPRKFNLRVSTREKRTPRLESSTDSVTRKPSVNVRGRKNQLTPSTGSGPGTSARHGSTISLASDQQTTGSEETSSTDTAQNSSLQPLTRFRWIVPPGGQVRLRLRFHSEKIGQFDQLLNFELLGTRKVYQIYCRAVCAIPSISREPRLVFPVRKRAIRPGEIVQKAYIIETARYEFGPLLIEKTKDRIKEGYYPENKAIITLVNTSPLEAVLRLGLLHDAAEEWFSLQPNKLILGPGESREICVWAHPQAAKRCEDAIVCCAKDNPEPVLFNLACDGAIPELELDKKVFNFEKVLLQRKDVRSINLHNPTLLPVQWKLSGVEALGEDFSVPQDAGIIDPKSDFVLYAYFRAMKPYKSMQKKSLRLEVYDLENLAGIVQVETIQVMAEAYDVALDISFPKGSDGGIDFGLLKVGEEVKNVITLKNKGPYEIDANFILGEAGPSKVKPVSVFTLNPQRLHLTTSDKSAQISLSFCSKTEYILREAPVLRCQVIEPNTKGNPELIASIPIKVSVRSVFSKFTLSPSKDISFGAIIVQHRKSRQLVIENNGDYEFRFSFLRMTKMIELVTAKENGVIKLRSVEMPLLSSPQARAKFGFFEIAPASGNVPPGNAQIVTIDCLAETQGQSIEELAIEISDRDTNMYRYGIPYQLFAEAHIPSIDSTDIYSIFEEHRICTSLSSAIPTDKLNENATGGMYGIEEKRFVFTTVLVGSRVRARFRISNKGKVPAEISLELRPVGSSPNRSGRSSSRAAQQPLASETDVFHLETARAEIAPHSSVYVSVTFAPLAMQKYNTSLCVYLENVPSASGPVSSGRGSSTPGATKQTSVQPVMNFELAGEGNLPRLTVLHPAIRNRQGQVMCVFRRLQLGRQEMHSLVMKNTGIFNSRINVLLKDSDHVFFMKPARNNEALLFMDSRVLPEEWDSDSGIVSPDILEEGANELTAARQLYTAGLLLRPGEKFTFSVYYRPQKFGMKSIGQILLTVVNNQYEDTLVELVGECLAEEVCIQDVPKLDSKRASCIREALIRNQPDFKPDGGKTDETDGAEIARDGVQLAAGLCHNLLDFGDCTPNEPVSQSFTLVHCGNQSDCAEPTSYRYAWPTNHPYLQFKPAEGHLHPNHCRRITVTFRSTTAPVILQSSSIKCTLHRIKVPTPEGCTEPPEWDDTKQVIRWIDAPSDQTRIKPTNADQSSRSLTGSGSSLRRAASGEGHLDDPGTPVGDFGSCDEVARRKQKIVEVEHEPHFDEFTEGQDPKPVELLVSAVADYARYCVDIDSINFKETQVVQKRIFRFELYNMGIVTLNYGWKFGPVRTLSTDLKIDAGEDKSIETAVGISDSTLSPFSVKPVEGHLLPGQSELIEVMFYPLSAGNWEAQLNGLFDTLAVRPESGQKGLVKGPLIIPVRGEAVQPSIYFELYDSDYITAGRRNPELPGPLGAPLGASLDVNTRVVEIYTKGIGRKSLKTFWVANLTTEDVEFVITDENSKSLKNPGPVKCTTTHGHIASGRKTEIAFEYTATSLTQIESFWRFTVAQLKFTVPLLVVASATEPNVFFDRANISLNPVLVGHTVSQVVNLHYHEDSSSCEPELTEPVEFHFAEFSRYGPGRQDFISVEPMTGWISPNSHSPIKISYTAKAEGNLNVSLICQVSYVQRPIKLNVKVEGYTISTSVWIDQEKGEHSHSELSPLWSPCLGTDMDRIATEVADRIRQKSSVYLEDMSVLSFGRVDSGESVSRTLTIVNRGAFKCDFACSLTSLRPRNERGQDGQLCSIDNIIEKLICGDLEHDLAHDLAPVISILPKVGTLKSGEKAVCKVIFSPPKQMNSIGLRKISLDSYVGACFVVRDGPAYCVKLSGKSGGTLVHFSASSIDFGTHFVTRPGLAAPVRCLNLRNKDNSNSVSVECLTQNSDIFQHSLVPTILQASKAENGHTHSDQKCCTSVDVWITFTPQKSQLYEAEFVFLVNGTSEHSVKLAGRGTEVHLEPVPSPLAIIAVKDDGPDRLERYLSKPMDTDRKTIDMGTLKEGQRSRRFVKLVNKSLAPICLHRLVISVPSSKTLPSESPLSEKGGTIRAISQASTVAPIPPVQVRFCKPVPEANQLELAPVSTIPSPIVLEPKVGQVMTEITFSSSVRLAPFIEEVVCEVSAVDRDDPREKTAAEYCDQNKLYLPVFAVNGAFRMHEINFDMTSINFGPIVRGSQLTKQVVLTNSGDLGVKFSWVRETIGPELSITPLEGYSAPETDVIFNFTLTPHKLAQELRMENVTCQFRGLGPKYVDVSAMCIPPTVVKDVQNFTTCVRQTDTRSLQIINRTNGLWELKPILDGEYWSGPRILEIKPQETGTYELTYKPLSMTTEGRKHKGTVFFPLPDGTGLLYSLCGTAEPPKPLGKISRDVECRKVHTEILDVPNWLNRAQHFRVTRETVRPDRNDPGTSLEGLNHVDVPAHGSKEYRLSFFTYREGITSIRVTFTNEVDGEYQFYDITFKAIRSKNLPTIVMHSPVRKSATCSVKIDNPLGVPVSFNLSTNIPEVQCPNQLQVPANCAGNVTLEFYPLRVGPYAGRFDVNCTELGLQSYSLDLEGTPAGPEATTHFQAALGQRQVRPVKFTNVAKLKTEFTTKIDSTEFYCDKQVTAAAGIEISLDVTYEPTVIDVSSATLIVTSSIAGEYVFPLRGIATEPQPQGPITVKAGETTYIVFRNVFPSTMLYTFQVDNTAFYLPKQTEIIRSRKDYRIPVGLDSAASNGALVAGKLIVTCVRVEKSARVGARRGPTNTTDATASGQAQSVARKAKSEPGEGMQWIYYLRGVSS